MPFDVILCARCLPAVQVNGTLIVNGEELHVNLLEGTSRWVDNPVMRRAAKHFLESGGWSVSW